MAARGSGGCRHFRGSHRWEHCSRQYGCSSRGPRGTPGRWDCAPRISAPWSEPSAIPLTFKARSKVPPHIPGDVGQGVGPFRMNVLG
jgi:hypothetical protein